PSHPPSATGDENRRSLPPLSPAHPLPPAASPDPDAGSDTAPMKLRATPPADGKSYELRGEKTWCTFANRAHVLTVLARTNPDVQPKHKGLSILLVEKEPGDDFDPPRLMGGAIPTIGYKGMKADSL